MRMLHIIRGKVKKGKNRGKLLGFPTLNMALHKNIPEGIYVSKTIIKGEIFPSVTFIGAAKTFLEKDVKAETYILDFSSEVYGQQIEVRLLKKIRENKKFTSEKQLISQMEKDILAARQFFSQFS